METIYYASSIWSSICEDLLLRVIFTWLKSIMYMCRSCVTIYVKAWLMNSCNTTAKLMLVYLASPKIIKHLCAGDLAVHIIV